MKNITLIFVIILPFLLSCTGSDVKNSLSEENLNGRVKTLSIEEYSFVEINGEPQKGDPGFKTISNYDEQGRVVESNIYVGSDLVRKTSYKYDEIGNQIEEINYEHGDKISYKTFKCDKKGNRIETKEYDSAGNLSGLRTCIYDKKGNRIELKLYDSAGNLTGLFINKYDKKGNNIETKFYKKGDKLYSTATMTYDDKGNQLEEKNIEPKMSYSQSSQYEQFDKEGNWLRKISTPNNSITERKIEYYSEEKKSRGSTKKLSQEKAENAIKQFISANTFRSLDANSISSFGTIVQFDENEASLAVDFNFQDSYTNEKLVLKFNFKRDIDKQWFLTSVEEISGVGSQGMSNQLSKWQNINIPVK